MSTYKIRRGEEMIEVEGFGALVDLVKRGMLAPDDAVFVPASNRWHYARSIRQLREHFPQVEDPLPPEGKVRDLASAERVPSVQQEDDGTAAEPTNVADVVRLRRGRWTPDGKGVEVPVFNYDIDLTPPPAAKPLRWAMIVGIGVVVGGLIWIYVLGYRRHMENLGNRSFEKATDVVNATPLPQQSGARAATPEPRVTMAVAAPTPEPTRGPAVPPFDERVARSKVLTAGVTAASRPDQLGPAMKTDLIKLAVPVAAAEVKPVQGKGKVVPFSMRIDYALGDGVEPALAARHYWMILLMAGRRASESRLNLHSVTVRTMRDGRVTATTTFPPELVTGATNGSAAPEDVLSRFAAFAQR